MSKGTIHRTVRIEDELWRAAREAAATNGESLSDVIRRKLREYIEDCLGSGVCGQAGFMATVRETPMENRLGRAPSTEVAHGGGCG